MMGVGGSAPPKAQPRRGANNPVTREPKFAALRPEPWRESLSGSDELIWTA